MKNYKDFIKEQLNINDPFGEEIWEDRFSFEYWIKRNYFEIDPLTIKTINCSFNKLTSLNGIENLRNLKYLYCYDNQLTSLNELENIKKLKYLNCSYNQLANLNGIENLANLKELYCNNNQLTDLNGVENLKNLKVLYCYNNNFSNEYKKYLKKLKIEEIYV